MTIVKYANGHVDKFSLASDALNDLREKYPDMQTFHDGQRTLVWADLASAENDDGQHAVAQITVE